MSEGKLVWKEFDIPNKLVDLIAEECECISEHLQKSTVSAGKLKENIRSSKNSWIPTNHWISKFCYQYVEEVNNGIFQYDIYGFEDLQFTVYSEEDYYNWHNDCDLNINQGESERKLSFILQLSNFDEYSGGEVQFLDCNENLKMLPKTKGTIIIFDSRTRHRVRKIKKGTRKSLVGWVRGPKWR
jgi:PKHD-type hydroxylase